MPFTADVDEHIALLPRAVSVKVQLGVKIGTGDHMRQSRGDVRSGIPPIIRDLGRDDIGPHQYNVPVITYYGA